MEIPDGAVAMDTVALGLSGGRRGWEPRRHALLIVIGEIGTEAERGALRGALERGIRSWNIHLPSCDLNQQLRLFVSQHLAQFSSEFKGSPVTLRGQVIGNVHHGFIHLSQMSITLSDAQAVHCSWKS
ncbi:microtubule-associated protein 1B-like [Emydura macquarii macquarii]|uniref:microtubule-associated protein 1B-like n=1 Tax=Emydura macquarii macquarii TaxID=1129001 RepID=UPI00352B6389